MGQVAALEALTNGLGEKDRMVESYNQRRRLIVQGFRDIGLDCHEPQGAFYAFPSIQKTGLSSDVFAERLLTENKVAAVQVTCLGHKEKGFYVVPMRPRYLQLNEALERIGILFTKFKRGLILRRSNSINKATGTFPKYFLLQNIMI